MPRFRTSAAAAAASSLFLSSAVIAALPAHAAPAPAVKAADCQCDFNGDGYDEVVTGAPGGTVRGAAGAGYVTVVYTGPNGFHKDTEGHVFSQGTAGVPGGAEAGDVFGQAVGSGDLDGDGYDDLIIGAPGENLGVTADAGSAIVLWGSASGLTGANSSVLTADTPTARDSFGRAFAAAHFDGTTAGDQLAVMTDSQVMGYAFEAGDPQRLDLGPQTLNAPPDIMPKGLTFGDYDENGFADLAVSGTSLGSEPGHGWTYTYAGQADGLVLKDAVRGGPSVASGDINGDGFDDLVTGEPAGPDDGGATMTGGTVGVRYGAPTWLDTTPDWWTQDSARVPGVAEQGDGWGSDLSVEDAGGDGFADVAIGAPGEDIGSVANAGASWYLPGTPQGITGLGSLAWNQGDPNVPGTVEAGDRFGGEVVLYDASMDGKHSMTIAAPGENTNDGHVWVLMGGWGEPDASGSWTYNGATYGANALNARLGTALDDE